jgi:NADH-quinone oxidoreductase subunit N
MVLAQQLINLIIPLGVLLGAVVITLITGKLFKTDLSRGIGIASLIVAIILFAVRNPFTGIMLFNDVIVLDVFGGFFAFMFLGLAILVLLGSMKMLDDTPESVALILLATIGMIAVGISNDLLMLVVSWEIMSLATYVLAGLGKKKMGTEAAMKYFIYGAVSSALILFAVSLVYGVAGTTKIDQLGTAFAAIQVTDTGSIAVIALAATIFIFGFGYKMGMVPFHLWLPDVYQGAPAPVSGFLAGVAKKVAIVAAVRIFLSAIVLTNFRWDLVFAIVAVITMTVGNIAALAQKNVYRMFAYSSISQMGYILIGFAVLDTNGLAASMMQVTMHALTTVGSFVAIGVISYRRNLDTYDGYKGLGRKNPGIATALSVMMISLAGIPPLGGFFSKLFLFRTAVEGGLLWLTIIGVLNSVLSLGYYLPLIRNMFLEKSEVEEEVTDVKPGLRMLGPNSVAILSAIGMFVLAGVAQLLFNVILQAAGAVI